MPCTAIKIIKEDGTIMYSKFMTVHQGGHIDLDVFKCNEYFIPIGEPALGYTPPDMDEETYHKKLRKEASDKGQYIPEESTNPEWNP